jgi:hypothetical protein
MHRQICHVVGMGEDKRFFRSWLYNPHSKECIERFWLKLCTDSIVIPCRGSNPQTGHHRDLCSKLGFLYTYIFVNLYLIT